MALSRLPRTAFSALTLALAVTVPDLAAPARMGPVPVFPSGCWVEVGTYFSDGSFYPRRICWKGPGELFAGRHEDPTTKSFPIYLLREGQNGVEMTLYPTPQALIPDPDVPLHDPDSSICRGVDGLMCPGVIVGSGLSDQLGRLSYIRDSDGMIFKILGDSSDIHNPEDLAWDLEGCLLVAVDHGEGDSATVWRICDGKPGEVFFYVPTRLGSLAVDPRFGWIFTGAADGIVRAHDPAGKSLSDDLLRIPGGIGKWPPVAIGPAGTPWEGFLYTITKRDYDGRHADGSLLRIPLRLEGSKLSGGPPEELATGFPFSDEPHDLEFGPEGALYLSMTFGHSILRIARTSNRELPGDCNQDGSIDIGDPVCLLSLLLGVNWPAPPCGDDTLRDTGSLCLLDANQDSAVDLSDGFYMLSWLFLGGPQHKFGTACLAMGCRSDPSCP